MSLVGPFETAKLQLFYNWHKIGTFQLKFDKNFFFINTHNHFTMLCKNKVMILSLFKL